jgi:hypothetical protein
MNLSQTRYTRVKKILSRTSVAFVLSAIILSPIAPTAATASTLTAQGHHKIVKGALTVLHIDNTNGTNSTEYQIEEQGTKKIFKIHPKKDDPRLVTGSIVEADGFLSSDQTTLTNTEPQQIQIITNAPAQLTKIEKTIVILVNFSDNKTEPFTQTEIGNMTFGQSGSVSSYYSEDSFNQTSFVGDVTSAWITLPYAESTLCSNYYSVGTDADAAAAQAGYDVNSYNHKVYLFPTTQACGWSGVATIGGSRSWVISNDTVTTVEIMTHELGHNLTWYHASTRDCGTKQIDAYANCFDSEYGDQYDPMGSPNLFHSNASHKEATGWLSPMNILSVTTEGTYTVAPIETQNASVQEIKISKPDTFETYTLDYRTPQGLDAALPQSLTAGAMIHVGNSNTYLLDVTAGDGTFTNAAFTDGATFTDTSNNIYITQISHDSTGATLHVGFTPPCIPKNPTITLSPSTNTAVAGTNAVYGVTLTNNDSSQCANSSWNLSASVPSGWTYAYDLSPLSLAPGATASTSLRVAAPQTTGSGSSQITVTATDSSSTSHGGQAVATQSTTLACFKNNPTLTLSPLSQSAFAGTALTYSLNLLNNDSIACGPANFSFSSTLPQNWRASFGITLLSVQPGANANTSITVTSTSTAPATAYTFLSSAVDISDAQHTSQTSGTYVVTPSCVPKNPTVSISPSSQTGSQGQTLQYSVNVTNNDIGPCSQRSYNFFPTVPNGWIASGAASVTIGPSTSASSLLSVTSSSSAANGTYVLTVKGTDSSDASRTNTGNATYTVFTPGDTSAPVTTITKPVDGSRLSGTSVDITASATDNVKVTKLEIYIDSKLVGSSTLSPYTYHWSSLNKISTGAHVISAKGYDAAGNVGTKNITVYK